MIINELKIGNISSKLPLIQGGMGVGISRSRLAGAVAKEGGIGIISTAQIGYDEPDFKKDPMAANLIAVKKHLRIARELSDNTGLIGVNIMVATKNYKEYVAAAIEGGTDIIISGAGLPISLPEYVKDTDVKIAPIVSSLKSVKTLLKMWDRKYQSTADLVVIEGPKAGGHLGFSKDDLINIEETDYDNEIRLIIEHVKLYEEKYNKKIPVVTAGGILTKEDIEHQLSLGANGVQIATPFVTTAECDASKEFKEAYINAKKEDIVITISPVGMPGRAVNNKFLKSLKNGKSKINKCFFCLEKCNPATAPYCITKALINAVKGDIDNGLIFCGTNAAYLDKITTVKELINSWFY